ncbi:hypothetical protein [Mycobacteroides chelonae]|jgi:hypothetical protein|uniref:Uncharacterized protein n=1 Tax=Mycobacteroides chelonae TaxID=1774 RepID=A0AB73LXL8_MYCCH|nr:hypothetical protein [Mycobacteroides chelonae]MBF9329090.1 hypothetical protein [Mycobacteroides chelonae]MBF9423130.1 hypothetical protein [Mycobacteroides chelonae]MBF9434806.1 hypothetical protein [Mycobacteroides chelonae]MBV6362901.1 hypothetical protein [Mycobacteroides chelonae]OHT49336.1 hypothetical protein BKG62_17090 [Mycobacteroides chelonae]
MEKRFLLDNVDENQPIFFADCDADGRVSAQLRFRFMLLGEELMEKLPGAAAFTHKAFAEDGPLDEWYDMEVDIKAGETYSALILRNRDKWRRHVEFKDSITIAAVCAMKRTDLITFVRPVIGGTYLGAYVQTSEPARAAVFVYKQEQGKAAPPSLNGLPQFPGKLASSGWSPEKPSMLPFAVSQAYSDPGPGSSIIGVLSPGNLYDVLFVVMTEDGRWDWDVRQLRTDLREVTVTFDRVHVTNDADESTSGEIHFKFQTGCWDSGHDPRVLQTFDRPRANITDGHTVGNLGYAHVGALEAAEQDVIMTELFFRCWGDEMDIDGKDRAEGSQEVPLPSGYGREKVEKAPFGVICRSITGDPLAFEVYGTYSVRYASS